MNKSFKKSSSTNEIPTGGGINETVLEEDLNEMELAFQRVEEKMITKTGHMKYLKGDEPKNIQTFVVSGGTMDMLLAAIDEAFEQYQPRHPNDKITSVNYCLSFAWKKLERDKAITSGKTAQPITRVRSYQIIKWNGCEIRSYGDWLPYDEENIWLFFLQENKGYCHTSDDLQSQPSANHVAVHRNKPRPYGRSSR